MKTKEQKKKFCIRETAIFFLPLFVITLLYIIFEYNTLALNLLVISAIVESLCLYFMYKGRFTLGLPKVIYPFLIKLIICFAGVSLLFITKHMFENTIEFRISVAISFGVFSAIVYFIGQTFFSVGNIYIFTTDTVFGIGCPLWDEKAVNTIKKIKGREEKKPLAILCANLEQVKKIAKNIEDKEKYTNLWPGALTIVFERTDKVKDYVTGGLDSVGIRIPKSDELLKFLEINGPFITTSVNKSGEEPIVNINKIKKFIKWGHIKIFNEQKNNQSSTVIGLNDEILRQGSIKIQ